MFQTLYLPAAAYYEQNMNYALTEPVKDTADPLVRNSRQA
jgi:hypothetical protein